MKEEYEDWNQHHPPSEIEFESAEHAVAGSKESITLEITTASEQQTEWNVIPIMNSLEVHEYHCTHYYNTCQITIFSFEFEIQVTFALTD